MQLAEFKAWFEGFTEDMDGSPTGKQWKRIKEQVAAIDGVRITERVYVDRYWPTIYPSRPYWTAYGVGSGICNSVMLAGQNAAQYSTAMGDGGTAFDSHQAMFALGKAEALAQ